MLVDIRKDQITEHFRLSEFVNTLDGNRIDLSPEFFRFVFMLENFRRWYGRPVNITSGFRTAAYNRKVGGASNSLHLKTLAIDFRLPSDFKRYSKARQNEFLTNVRNKWFQLCDLEGIPGSVLWYDTWVHLDYRTDRRYFEDKRGK
jgi:hypothetical protein